MDVLLTDDWSGRYSAWLDQRPVKMTFKINTNSLIYIRQTRQTGSDANILHSGFSQITDYHRNEWWMDLRHETRLALCVHDILSQLDCHWRGSGDVGASEEWRGNISWPAGGSSDCIWAGWPAHSLAHWLLIFTENCSQSRDWCEMSSDIDEDCDSIYSSPKHKPSHSGGGAGA